tara:strand:+ start:243 stop:500 length:258 start_codon:yes stop_codon:yes gene_type:complete
MSYDKLRYLEQLLSSLYSEGVDNYRKEIELYFEENYGEDSLVKPVYTKETKEVQDKPEQRRKLIIPDDLDERLNRAVKRAFGRSK